MITVTESAAEYIKKQFDKNHTTAFRLGVKNAGCNSKKYTSEYTNEKHDTDKEFIDKGVHILVDKAALPYLIGTEIDYVKEGLNRTIKFNNPNVSTACGCGESFDVS
jgi:iron-sulfur cluster assembly protein